MAQPDSAGEPALSDRLAGRSPPVSARFDGRWTTMARRATYWRRFCADASASGRREIIAVCRGRPAPSRFPAFIASSTWRARCGRGRRAMCAAADRRDRRQESQAGLISAGPSLEAILAQIAPSRSRAKATGFCSRWSWYFLFLRLMVGVTPARRWRTRGRRSRRRPLAGWRWWALAHRTQALFGAGFALEIAWSCAPCRKHLQRASRRARRAVLPGVPGPRCRRSTAASTRRSACSRQGR